MTQTHNLGIHYDRLKTLSKHFDSVLKFTVYVSMQA